MDGFEIFCYHLTTAIRRSPYTRAELADQLGVKASTIKSWCVGRRSPTVQRMVELCAVLGLEPSALLTKPATPPNRTSCAVCKRSFRRYVGYRIHVALRAREDDGHRRLHEREERGPRDPAVTAALEELMTKVSA